MSVCLKDLRLKRLQCVEAARSIYRNAQSEHREPNSEEKRNFDLAMGEAERMEGDIQRLERLDTVQRSLRESAGSELRRETPGRVPDGTFRGSPIELKDSALRAFDTYFRTGDMTELRALQSDINPLGGYATMTQQLATGVIKAVDDALSIRRMATRYTLTSAHSLGVLSLESDPADPTWTTELGTGAEDTAMAFGLRELCPHPLAQRIKISEKLMRSSPLVVNLVQERLAYKVAAVLENAYMTGNGAGKPLGLFTASSQGISTSRDVSTGNTSTSLTIEGLVNALYTLKDQYRNNPKTCSWLFHRDALKQIRKLRSDSGAGTGTGDFLWQPSVQLGQPDMLLGLPCYSSEFIPHTFTTGLYVGIVGDFSKYAICDALSMTIKRLDELYAETAQVGFISRLESDGMPLLEEAFVRVKLA